MLKKAHYEQYVAAGYTHVPLALTRLADLDTPLSIFYRLRAHQQAYLFESIHGGERWGRYSIIGFGGVEVLEYYKGEMLKRSMGDVERYEVDDPFVFLRQYMAYYKLPPQDELQVAGLPKFMGGLVGFFAYDSVRYIEPKLGYPEKDDPIALPDIWLMKSDQCIVFDNLKGTLSIIVLVSTADANAYDAAVQQLQAINEHISAPLSAEAMRAPLSDVHFSSNIGQIPFENAVKKVQEYIAAGDVMQVVPSQRMTSPFSADPLDVYRAIRHINPSPYLFYVQGATLGVQANRQAAQPSEFQLIGSSPEILTRFEEGKVVVRPIAGTRPRGKSQEEDAAHAADLLADSKEIAEHLMLIDLGRNDVGRVSQTGRVSVTEQMVIERYSHVMHIVSNVEGVVEEGLDAFDVFKATFPAGTLSGAPKIRAMEIIDELEPAKRCVFGGAVGYINWHGDMDTAIAIRTAVVKDSMVHVQAGAGVVADSVPVSEWNETLIKSRAMMKAVEMAANRLKID